MALSAPSESPAAPLQLLPQQPQDRHIFIILCSPPWALRASGWKQQSPRATWSPSAGATVPSSSWHHLPQTRDLRHGAGSPPASPEPSNRRFGPQGAGEEKEPSPQFRSQSSSGAGPGQPETSHLPWTPGFLRLLPLRAPRSPWPCSALPGPLSPLTLVTCLGRPSDPPFYNHLYARNR